MLPPTVRTYVRTGTGDAGEEAFYRVAEEGLVSYDRAKVNWRAYKVCVCVFVDFEH